VLEKTPGAANSLLSAAIVDVREKVIDEPTKKLIVSTTKVEMPEDSDDLF
jgi:hypothetical protein